MAVQPGSCQTWSEIPEDRLLFSRDAAQNEVKEADAFDNMVHLGYKILFVCFV